jgi:mono/diheme cytochrome c family protein
MKFPTITTLMALGLAAGAVGPAWSQDATEDVQKGRHIAEVVCWTCHVVAQNQEFAPMLQPPAPTFASISRRSNVTADYLRKFIATTHRDISKPQGMPNPQLLDFQIEQVVAYIMTLRGQSTGQLTPLPEVQPGQCAAQITRIETALRQARGQSTVGSAPESNAARMHRQPTPDTVSRAETEATKNFETTLAAAKKLGAAGKEAECLAVLKDVAAPLGMH